MIFQRGVAYLQLGFHGAARDLIGRASEALPDSLRRDHGRLAAALAVACAQDGDPASAVSAARRALTTAEETGSAYTIADLRRVPAILRRQQYDPDAVRRLSLCIRRVSGDIPAR
jgi:hypothetical protein